MGRSLACPSSGGEGEEGRGLSAPRLMRVTGGKGAQWRCPNISSKLRIPEIISIRPEPASSSKLFRTCIHYCICVHPDEKSRTSTYVYSKGGIWPSSSCAQRHLAPPIRRARAGTLVPARYRQLAFVTDSRTLPITVQQHYCGIDTTYVIP